ncbi:MAG: HD-GYP domain-containing protein, partial [Fervidobacterium sp.]
VDAKFKEGKVINTLIDKINTILKINDAIRHLPINTTVEEFINTIGPLLCVYFKSQRFSVAFIDWENESIIAETAYITFGKDRIRLGPGFTQKFTETTLGNMIRNNQTIHIINNFQERYKETKSLSLKLLIEEGFNSNITILASINSRPFGFLFLSSVNTDNYTKEDAKLFLSIANTISYRLFYSLTIQKVLSEFGNSLVNIVEFKDNETGNHIKRVALYSKLIAQELELDPKLVREIYEYASIHDIGKVGVPDSILLKPGKLNTAEWEIMKTHVKIGVSIIKNFEEQVRNIIQSSTLEVMKNIIADHHEWWNGNGYPKGKKGEEISIEGRIIAIADVFDALTTKRPYKEAIPFEKAVEMIKEENGTHFDPKVFGAFLRKLQEIRDIYERLKD